MLQRDFNQRSMSDSMLLRPLFLAFAILISFSINAIGAQRLEVDYRCDGTQIFDGDHATTEGWHESPSATVSLQKGGAACWARILAVKSNDQALSFTGKYARVQLYDDRAKLLGSADRFGQSQNTLVTIHRSLFSNLDHHGGYLYARLAMDPYHGYERDVSIELVNYESILEQERRHENFQVATLTALLVIILASVLFALALQENDYLLFALYSFGVAAICAFRLALPQQLTHSPIFAWMWFCAMYPLTNALGLIVITRLGRFAETTLWAHRTLQWVAIAFVVLVPFWFFAATLADHLNSALNLISLPILYFAFWRARHNPDWAGPIIVLGITPKIIAWVPSFIFELTGVALPFDFIENKDWLGLGSDLLLPLMFLGILALRSLSARKRSTYLEEHDPITNLPNRSYLKQLDIEHISASHELVVLVLNVKRFSAINKALGTRISDQLLAEIGKQLNALGATYIARLHADQFCVITTEPQLNAIRTKLTLIFNHPIEVNGQIVDLAVTVGAARMMEMYDPTNINEKPNMVRLLREAEIAVEVAREHKLDWIDYDKALETVHHWDLSLMSELKHAIVRKELRLYLQPKIRLRDGAMISAEALLRWQHPTRGLITPEHFIPFAEQTGCIRMITHWALEQAMELSTKLRSSGKPIQIAVNLSAIDLGDVKLLDLLTQLLKKKGANPADIRMELTEHSAMNNIASSLEVMRAIRDLGFSLSIDDFGTGYSSLAYLQRMPVAELKIDRAFIHNVQPDSDGFILLKSIIELGHVLDLSIVAEGIETKEEWTMLCNLKCDFMQGYFSAPAMTMENFEKWRDNNTPFFAEKAASH